MSRRILFSPVGGTDPISQNNAKDGSLLHICRVYQPDIVYMYLSSEILQYQAADDRYRYCIKKLEEKTGHKMEVREIERLELKDVQDYDYFYSDFKDILHQIRSQCDSDDELLINVSSGTPAMKSGLLVLVTLGEFPCRAIQVLTPVRKMNEHTHKGFDVQLAWELDEDNEDGFENRCREVKCPTLSKIKQEELIRKLIESYDYSAALEAARMLPKEDTAGYLPLLEMSVYRYLLQDQKALAIAKRYNLDAKLFPIQSSNQIRLFEYALWLKVKVERNEYADFVRGITPLIVDLFTLIINHECRITITDYFRYDNRKKMYVWDENRLSGTNVYQILENKFSPFRYGAIYSSHLCEIIQNIVPEKTDLAELCGDLRGVEADVRNLAAHEVVSITNDFIRARTGFSAEQILQMLKKAFRYTDIHVKNEYWNCYDLMNQAVDRMMAGEGN